MDCLLKSAETAASSIAKMHGIVRKTDDASPPQQAGRSYPAFCMVIREVELAADLITLVFFKHVELISANAS